MAWRPPAWIIRGATDAHVVGLLLVGGVGRLDEHVVGDLLLGLDAARFGTGQALLAHAHVLHRAQEPSPLLAFRAFLFFLKATRLLMTREEINAWKTITRNMRGNCGIVENWVYLQCFYIHEMTFIHPSEYN